MTREYQPRGEASLRGKPLSKRESQVVAMVSCGLPNKEVAFELGLTAGTVKTYLSRIFDKLGVANRTALAIWHQERFVIPERGLGDCGTCLLRAAHLKNTEVPPA